MTFDLIKAFFPNHPVPVRIWRGPFRGARLVMNPRHSMRKIVGLYEHELNGWLSAALRNVDRIVDVGANDGYFTFGCVAAFQRCSVKGSIIAFEPEERHATSLHRTSCLQQANDVTVKIMQSFVGREVAPGFTTLDAMTGAFGPGQPRTNTLIKIDVEGAEMEVIAGAQSWLQPSNAFVIEVHKRSYIEMIQTIFSERGLVLKQIDQRSLPVLGRENRAEENWWLVSDLLPGGKG